MVKKLFLNPGPWFMASAGMALVGDDYFNAALLFIVALIWM